MSDPALAEPLAQLASVLKELQAASDTLNQQIMDFEKELVALKPGISVWTHTLLVRPIENIGSPVVGGSQFGFTRVGENWGLCVRRGSYKPDAGRWHLFEEHPCTTLRLTDASREERIAAIKEFPMLVALLTAAAVERLETVENAT